MALDRKDLIACKNAIKNQADRNMLYGAYEGVNKNPPKHIQEIRDLIKRIDNEIGSLTQ